MEQQFKIPIQAAALQFCNSNPAVSTMILGMDRPNQINQNLEFLNFEINNDFWLKLLENGKKEQAIKPISEETNVEEICF